MYLLRSQPVEGSNGTFGHQRHWEAVEYADHPECLVWQFGGLHYHTEWSKPLCKSMCQPEPISLAFGPREAEAVLSVFQFYSGCTCAFGYNTLLGRDPPGKSLYLTPLPFFLILVLSFSFWHPSFASRFDYTPFLQAFVTVRKQPCLRLELSQRTF